MPIDDLSRPVPQREERARPTIVRYLVLAAFASAAVISYLTRACTAPAGSTIQHELHLSDPEMGYIHSGFFAGYILAQIPGGWFGNRLGARRALTLLSLAWSACTLWTAWSGSFAMLWVSRVAVGFAQGGLFPIAAKVIVDWFPETRRGIASAVITAFMSVGSIIANGLTVYLMEPMGWRGAFEVYCLVGVVWAIAFYAWFRNRPAEHWATNKAERNLIRGSFDEWSSIPAGQSASAVGPDEAAESGAKSARMNFDTIRIMATSASMWAICSQSFFRAFGYVLFITWFPSFLERSYALTVANAGRLNMLPLLGVVLGCFVGGWVVDQLLTLTGSKWLSRSGVAAGGLALCALATLLAIFARDPLVAVTIIAIGALFSGLGGPTTWAATMDIGGNHTAIVFAIMNTAGNVGAIACPILLGYLIDYIRRVGGDWNLVLYLFAFVYLAGAASWLLLDPNRSAVERPAARLAAET